MSSGIVDKIMTRLNRRIEIQSIYEEAATTFTADFPFMMINSTYHFEGVIRDISEEVGAQGEPWKHIWIDEEEPVSFIH